MVFLGILVDIPYRNYSSIAAYYSSLFQTHLLCYNRYVDHGVLQRSTYYVITGMFEKTYLFYIIIL